jgi:hypothetical protein
MRTAGSAATKPSVPSATWPAPGECDAPGRCGGRVTFGKNRGTDTLVKGTRPSVSMQKLVATVGTAGFEPATP